MAYSGAQDELTKVAELLGAEVWEADAGELNMSYSHPLYQGMTGHMFGSASLPLMQSGDVNLVCGTYILPEVFPILGDIFADDAKIDPHRSQRLRDRQEPSGRSRRDGRSQADAGAAGRQRWNRP